MIIYYKLKLNKKLIFNKRDFNIERNQLCYVNDGNIVVIVNGKRGLLSAFKTSFVKPWTYFIFQTKQNNINKKT